MNIFIQPFPGGRSVHRRFVEYIFYVLKVSRNNCTPSPLISSREKTDICLVINCGGLREAKIGNYVPGSEMVVLDRSEWIL